jgi:hypothetical protein
MSSSQENAQALTADFRRCMETRFPQWLEHVHILRDGGADEEFLELTIPDPLEITHENPLEISTWGEEVTVSFAGQHRHFSWPEAYDGSDNRNRVMDYIQAMMDEEIVIASIYTQGGRKLVSDARPEDIGKYPRAEKSDYELRVRSWRGTYDDQFPINWQSYLEASCL